MIQIPLLSQASTFTPEDIQALRDDTPGTRFFRHFNYAGSSFMAASVHQVVQTYQEDELRRGGYETAQLYAAQYEQIYSEIASMIGAQPQEIALAESATIAWYKAFGSFAFEPGDIILTCEAEYGSNFVGFLQAQKLQGIEIQVIPNNEFGELDLDRMAEMISPKVKLIAITHIPTHSGLVNPANEVGKIAQAAGIPYLLDACQSAGQYPLDVREIGCDFLSVTGRKYMRAPRGTGFLYVREAMLEHLTEPPSMDLWSAMWTERDRYEIQTSAKRFENFENNKSNRLGLGAAASYYNQLGRARIWQQVSANAAAIRKGLRDIRGVKVQDTGREQCGIVTFEMEGWHPSEIQEALHRDQIQTSISLPFGARLDMENRGIEAMVRASTHYVNDESDIQALLASVEQLALQQPSSARSQSIH
ncbi:aminotransferase class V-fold PLP-dependent enzyme [Pontibacter sp. G13]|uniref:aminotransferase class V-fold PLP-dependent enzyme n=1 Tax=Pontibacter sp. G13 TaxID=3074898 RepID=UPI002889D595|nr:aminotransferase class V-fold PLP-dependent enzyme [Pontibacter sp. G13]WNJ19282.1 aminotransferase class V-fold PLP-dependent enzyme [Pontibacter sp. G13]